MAKCTVQFSPSPVTSKLSITIFSLMDSPLLVGSGVEIASCHKGASAYFLECHLASPPDESHHHPVADATGREPIPAHPPKRADGLRLSS